MVVRKKSFGQHFLHDRKVMHDIARAVGYQPGERIIEIGPGTGRLTRCLLEHIPLEALSAVELDREMIAHLLEAVPGLPVEQADAARVDWSATLSGGDARLVGNLPYNAAAPIFFNALDHRRCFRRLVFMFQKEMAERFTALPGTDHYGAPSVITRLLTEPRWLCIVKPSAFRPPPRVDSAVVVFDPRPEPLLGIQEAEVPAFSSFTHGIFRQRRKTLRNNLRELTPEADRALAEGGIDGTARPETLPLEIIVQLFRLVRGASDGHSPPSP